MAIDVVSAVVGWLVAFCSDSGVRLVRGQHDERSLKKTMSRALGTVVIQADPAVRPVLERGLARYFAASPKLSFGGAASVRDALTAAVAGQMVELEQWVADATGRPFGDVVDMEPAEFIGQVSEAVVTGLRQYAAAGELTELVRALDTAEIMGRLEVLGLQITELAVPARAAATFSLPRDIASFTGRGAELERIVQVLDSADPDTGAIDIHAIDGMAGIGKTALALRTAHFLAPRFQDGQLFLHLHGHTPGQRPVDPADALVSLLLAVGVPASRIPADRQTRSALWRQQLRTKRILLLLDDAVSSEQIRHLLPGSPGCLVLITSRRRLTALEGVVPISLETLPPTEATVLFSRLAARPGLFPSDPHVEEVVRLCGYLPLAIRLTAGKLAHHPSWTVRDLVADLTRTQNRIAAMRAEDDSVASAFDLSYHDLAPDPQLMFRRLGLHPGSEIDAYVAAALADMEMATAQELLDDLFMHHLIEEPARGSYRMHDLVRQKAKSLVSLDLVLETETALDRMLDYYLHTAQHAAHFVIGRAPASARPTANRPPAWTPEINSSAQALDWLREQRANLHAAIDFAAFRARPTHAIYIAAAMNDFLRIQGHWDEAVAVHQCALEAATRTGDTLGRGLALGNLGSVQRLQGQYPAAVRSQQQAQRAYREVGDRLGEANAVHELGVAQRLCSDYAADQVSQEQAGALYRSLDNKLGEANTLHELGTMYFLMGNLHASLTAQARALEMFQDIGKPYGLAFAYNELAVVSYLMGDYPAAGTHVAHGMSLHTELGNTFGEAYSLKELGVVEYLTGNLRAAITTLTSAVDLHRQLGSRYGMGLALTDLGVAQRLSGEHATALSTLIQALSLHREFAFRYGEGCTLKELAVVKDALGHRAGAEADLASALHLHTEFGHRHGLTDTMITQGDLLLRHGEHDSAQDKFTRSLEPTREIGAPLLEARAIEGLGHCLLRTDDTTGGLASLRQAQAIYLRIGAPDLARVEEALRGR
ncbi:tetratricopeptide repeat protein [Streptomyces sp. NPDC023998]|uniref:ATP-binding protein n=1 Tax=Streptomyces sp. NPDC023998 TaxID=3154597 RepID=UPI0033F24465